GLLAYAVVFFVFSPSDRGITFTPAEVNLLFSGPFTRRQLLTYKMMVTFLTCLMGTAFMTLVFQVHAYHTVAAFVGLLGAMGFVQLIAMIVSLLAQMAGQLAYNRVRKLVLLLVTVLIVVSVLRWGKGGMLSSWDEVVDTINQSPVLAVL